MGCKQLKVYGERNSGTNYLTQLLWHNFQVEILPGVVPALVMGLQNMLPGQELVRDVYFALSFRANLVWKHSFVHVERLKRTLGASSDVGFVTITKNPYAWMLSLYKRPYHRHGKEKPDFETFLQTPWKTVGRENASKTYPNPAALWNLKNESYMALKQEFPTVNVSYEALLSHPGEGLTFIKDHFSLNPKHKEFKNLNQSTKDPQKTFMDYQDYYLQGKWKDQLSAQSIELINANLNWGVMEYFGYKRLN